MDPLSWMLRESARLMIDERAVSIKSSFNRTDYLGDLLDRRKIAKVAPSWRLDVSLGERCLPVVIQRPSCAFHGTRGILRCESTADMMPLSPSAAAFTLN